MLFLTPHSLMAFDVGNAHLLKQDHKAELKDSKYLYLNHSASYWDWEFHSLSAVEDLLIFSKQHKWTSIGAVNGDAFLAPDIAKSYYFNGQQVDYVQHSDWGAHRLEFPDAKQIIVGGGNISVCLCESLRDTVRGLINNKNDVEILMVREAIFDTDFYGMPATAEEFKKFVAEFYLPNFPCPSYTSSEYSPLSESFLTQNSLNIYYDQTLLTQPDSSAKRKINIRFVSLEKVKQLYY